LFLFVYMVVLVCSGPVAHQLFHFSIQVHEEESEETCSSWFSVKFSGEDSEGRFADGLGRVDCEGNRYVASVTFPAPGNYELELGRLQVLCKDSEPRPVLEPGRNKASLQLTVLSSVVGVNTEPAPPSHRCTLRDLESAKIGSYYQVGACKLPDCEGTPRESYWGWPGLVWRPHHCHLRYYDAEELVTRLQGKTVMFLGDSTMDEAVEGFLMLAGVEEQSVLATMSVDWNYTDFTGQILVRNLHRHRLIEADFVLHDLHVLHRFTGHSDLDSNALGTATFNTTEFLDYFFSHFGPEALHPPDLVVFNSGRHDSFSSVGEQTDKMDWLAGHMTELAAKVNTKLLWRSSNVANTLVWDMINDRTAMVMRRHGIPVVDVSGPGLFREKDDRLSMTDGVHFGFTAISHGAKYLDGHEAMTQILLQGIFDTLGV